MKNYLLTIALVITFLNTKAQLFFKNNTQEPVMVCIAYYQDMDSFKGFTSQGWYKIDPGENLPVSTSIGTTNFIYYYAKSTSTIKEYNGDINLLVNPSETFFIKNCDKAYVKTEHLEYEYKKFRSVDMKNNVLKTKFTIELNF